MVRLLEAMHAEALPPEEDPEHLCRLLRLAHFYSVDTVLKEASQLLTSMAGSLSVSQCAAAMVALHPLAEAAAAGPCQATAACAAQLRHLLHPLDIVLDDTELGEMFDQLPLVAVLEATEQALIASSQETGGHRPRLCKLFAVTLWLAIQTRAEPPQCVP